MSIQRHKWMKVILFILFCVLLAPCVHAETTSMPILLAKTTKGATEYSLSIKLIAVMAILSILPALLVTLTAFTRIIIVLAILRQGLGIANVPNNQVLLGLALILTFYVMSPIFMSIDKEAIEPYFNNSISFEQALSTSSAKLKVFLLKQTRQADLNLFQRLSHTPAVTKNTDYSLAVIMPSFITSELKTAFQIGFLVLLPFLVIDLVIASVLMSMGMMLLSPMIISLPFKLLFFVLVDGWSLVITSLITSFRM